MNEDFKNKLEEAKKKMQELSDDELAKVSGGDNPAGMFMYEIGTKFCYTVQINTDCCTIIEIKDRYVVGIQNMYTCDFYDIDRNGNMIGTPDSNFPIEEWYFERACLHKGLQIYNK